MLDDLPTVCVLAGGRGSRLGEAVANVPKPLLEVAGQPFLLHQLRLLATHGVTDAVLCVGYPGEMIEERIGPEQFGVRISYSYDTPGLDGTLGAIRRALPLLPDRFLVLYGDTYLRLDYRGAVKHWHNSGLPALMTVLRNAGRWGVSNAAYEDGRVIAYNKVNPTAEMDWIDFGLGGLETRALSFEAGAERDLSALYTELAALGELCGYEVRERFYEIGSAASFREADLFLRDEEP